MIRKTVFLSGGEGLLSVSALNLWCWKKLLTDPQADGQGFLARCLVSMPDSRVSERRMQDINWSDVPAVVDFRRKLTTLYNTELTTKEKTAFLAWSQGFWNSMPRQKPYTWLMGITGSGR